MRAINLTLWPLDKGPRPKSGKSRLNLHGTILEGKSIDIQTQKKNKSAKKESSWFEEPRAKALGCNPRIQFASNESKLVPRNLDPGSPI